VTASSAPEGPGGTASGRGALDGRGIVVTRAEGPDGPVSTRLRKCGATPILRPAVAFDFASQKSALGEAAWKLADYDWLVLTSSRAVRALAAVHAFRHPHPAGLRVAVVGPGTAAEVETHRGWRADVVPESGGASVLVKELADRIGAGDRVLFPASEAAGETLTEALTAVGARVDRVDAYAPRPSPQPTEEWVDDLAAERIDALTFTSPSAVEALDSALAEALPAKTLDTVRALPAAVQGPTTAAAAEAAGWSTVLVAEPTTFDGLVEALDRHFAPETP